MMKIRLLDNFCVMQNVNVEDYIILLAKKYGYKDTPCKYKKTSFN